MKHPDPHPASLLALVLSASIAHADVVDTPTERQLSLPSAKVRLTLPRGDWVITDEERRSGDTAVFYALASEQRKMFFTVYIDKSTECLSAFTCRALAMKNPAYKDAAESKTYDLGKFSVSQFFVDRLQGTTAKQATVVASAYVDGYWFDIQISKRSEQRPDPGPLVDLLKEISIK